jgi:serine/threonine protein kinase/tetratricopeptide (TPR) repeat protein
MSVRLLAGRYELGGLINQGGMGDVFLGKDLQTDTQVAIKRLKRDVLQEDPTLVDRFSREAEALRRLNHPNIVKILDTVDDGGDHFIIMEYIAGGSLADVLKVEHQLPVERVVTLSLDLADALTRAHRLKIIHRDLKPANVLLAEDGTPRLSDFGVARVGETNTMKTQTGAILGTLAYLSPEVCQGEPYDERCDLWAFGVMLYEMLAGVNPFSERSPAAMLQAIMSKPTPDLALYREDVPPQLDALIQRMLLKDPLDRLTSARQVGAELEDILRNLPLDGDSAAMIEHLPPEGQSRFSTPTGKTGQYEAIPNMPTPVTPAPTWMGATPLDVQGLNEGINTPTAVPPLVAPAASGSDRRTPKGAPRIYVSYRETPDGAAAGRLVDGLRSRFGDENVLRDVNRITDRTISRLVLANDVIATCNVVIAVIGQGWAAAVRNPKDAARIELEAARKQPDMLIIPVLVEDAALPKAAELPPSLQFLAALTPILLSKENEDTGAKRIAGQINAAFGEGKRSRPWWQIAAVAAVLILLAIIVINLLGLDTQRTGNSQPNADALALEPVLDGEVMVLVADFPPSEGIASSSNAAEQIADDLHGRLAAETSFSPIQIRRYHAPITSEEQARQVAGQTGAALVVWSHLADGSTIELTLGSLDSIPSISLPEDLLERSINAQMQLTRTPNESIAPRILVALAVLYTSAGDLFNFGAMVAMLSEMEAVPAPVLGSSTATRGYDIGWNYVKDSPAALDQAADAIMIDGANPLLFVTRAALYQRLNDYNAALRDIQTAQRLGGAEWAMPYALLANDHIFQGNFTQAVGDYDNLIGLRPNDWFAYAYRGALHYLNGDTDAARADVEQALALNPKANFPYPIATLVAMRQGRITDASQLITENLRLFPDPSVTNRLIEGIYGSRDTLVFGDIFSGFNNLLLGQYDQALDDLYAPAQQLRQLSDLSLMQGFAYCNLSQYAASESAYTRGLAVDPNNPLLLMLRSEARVRRGDTEGAEADDALAAANSSGPEFDALLILAQANQITCENFFDLISELPAMMSEVATAEATETP